MVMNAFWNDSRLDLCCSYQWKLMVLVCKMLDFYCCSSYFLSLLDSELVSSIASRNFPVWSIYLKI